MLNLNTHRRIFVALCLVSIATGPGEQSVSQGADKADVKGNYIKVEIKGHLNSRVFKIGGETTGVEISANGVTWELKTAGNPQLKKMTQRLHGKTALVTGTLTVRKGVEIPKRWIVQVATIREPGKPDRAADYITDDGKLRHRLVLRDSQSGFAGVSGDLWTIETDGKWNRRRFLNKRIRDADRSGTLTASQLKQLAAELQKQALLKLPGHLGQRPPVNPHIFSISFGHKEVDLSLRGGADLPKPNPKDPKSRDLDRFVAVVRLIQR